MPEVTITLSADEMRLVDIWRENYMSADLPLTLEGVLHDMLRLIHDDIQDDILSTG